MRSNVKTAIAAGVVGLGAILVVILMTPVPDADEQRAETPAPAPTAGEASETPSAPQPDEEPAPQATGKPQTIYALPPDGQPMPGPTGPLPATPLGPEFAEDPGGALAAQLGLTPEEAERINEVFRRCEADYKQDMARIAERGYDDVAARHAGERFEARLIAEIERVLPPEAVPRFRALLKEEERGGR